MKTEEDEEFERIDREQAMGWRKRQIAEKQEQGEPVAEVKRNSSGQIYIEWRDGEFAIANLVEAKLYTTPQPVTESHKRKPLTDEEIKKCWDSAGYTGIIPKGFARAIEAAHGIKENT